MSRAAAPCNVVGPKGTALCLEGRFLCLGVLRALHHEAASAHLLVALAGSSQRMMQGLVLASHAPLYGRARELLDLGPIDASYLRGVFRARRAAEVVPLYAAWGGVPRYWELAQERGGRPEEQVEQLVLDPLGTLHREPDRLLIEEVPSALEVRPVLDAIGAGAHRVSEIAGRLGRPATSVSRPLERLTGMGLVRREVPFGESEKQSRRSLYSIDDPFFRLWFRVVAPNRARLAAGNRATRLQLLARHWGRLLAETWEDLCRKRLPRLVDPSAVARLGPWPPATRWWSGELPEWDLVSESADGTRLLLGEAKWSGRPLARRDLAHAVHALQRRAAPVLPSRFANHRIVRTLFVRDIAGKTPLVDDVFMVTAEDLLHH